MTVCGRLLLRVDYFIIEDGGCASLVVEDIHHSHVNGLRVNRVLQITCNSLKYKENFLCFLSRLSRLSQLSMKINYLFKISRFFGFSMFQPTMIGHWKPLAKLLSSWNLTETIVFTSKRFRIGAATAPCPFGLFIVRRRCWFGHIIPAIHVHFQFLGCFPGGTFGQLIRVKGKGHSCACCLDPGDHRFQRGRPSFFGLHGFGFQTRTDLVRAPVQALVGGTGDFKFFGFRSRNIGGGGKGNVQGVVFGKRRKGFRGAQTHV